MDEETAGRPGEPDRREVTRRRSRRGRRLWPVAAAAVLAACAFGVWYADPWGWFGSGVPGGGPRGDGVVLYFPDARWTALVAVPHALPTPPDPVARIKRIAEALAEAPEREGIDPLLKGVRVKGAYLGADGLAVVDLASEQDEFQFGGASGELLAVYSLVNSLTANIPEVRRVRLLRNGEEAATLAGHVKISEPLEADPSLTPAPGS